MLRHLLLLFVLFCSHQVQAVARTVPGSNRGVNIETLVVNISPRMLHQPGFIFETIISIAHNLGLELIAEGVETVEELQFLQLRGCSKFQGYYFIKPLPASQFTDKLLAHTLASMENAG